MSKPPANRDATPDVATPAPAPLRRRGRWLKRTSIAIALIVGLLLVLTRTWALRMFVEPRLEAALGCEVSMGRVILEPDGRIVIRNLRISVPGVQREAAEVVRARLLEARIDWGALFAGELRMTRVKLVRPRVRLSQSLEDDTLNLQAFPGGATPPSGAVSALPSVNIVDGVLEFGEHTATSYSVLSEVPIDGGATPRKDEPATYDISLREIVELRTDGTPSREPLILAGAIDTKAVAGHVRLFNVDLSRWTERTAPARYREQLRDLRIEGLIRETEFVFSRDEGLAAIFTLENVGMRLPVDAKPDPNKVPIPGEQPRRMEMRNVSGAIRFDSTGVQARALRGAIEDLTYEVTFVTEGLALGAPFRLDVRTVDGFTVASSPELLPFAPDIVRRRFATFSGPTAVIDAEVTVRRGPPTPAGPAQPTVAGVIRFRDGAAAYEDFTYPVTSLAGLVEFDEKEIRIEGITGIGPTGAKLFADGVISPPSEGAQVDLNITFADVPIDPHFEDSMPINRREIVAALVDRDAYQRLLDAQLVQPTEQRDAAIARLAELKPRILTEQDQTALAALTEEARALEQQVAIPAFDPGGRAELRIKIHRPFGPDTEWLRDIHVTMPTAGLLVRSFPYPVVATDVDLRIGEEFADVTIPSLKGLTGAEGTLTARICLEKAAQSVFEPDITIAATNAPVDELLIQAVPGDPTAAFSAPRLLRLLRLEGGVDCAAHITPRPNNEVGFDVGVRLDGLAARPDNPDAGAMPDEPLVAGLTGDVNITEQGLFIESLSGLIGDGRVDIRAEAIFPRGEVPASFESEIALSRLDLRAPLERVVTALSPEAGAAMTALREERNPAGVLDARIAIGAARLGEGDVSGVHIDARIDRVESFSFDLYGKRLSTGAIEGSATVSERRVEFHDLVTDLTFDGSAAGVANINGSLQFPGAVNDQPASLHLLLQDAPVESSLARAVLSQHAGATGKWFDIFTPSGRFDLDATLDTAPQQPAHLVATVRPRALAFTRNGVTMDFSSAQGAITLDATLAPGGAVTGAIDDLKLASEDLSVSLDGPWRAGGPMSVDLTLSAEAAQLSERVRAALPVEVAEILQQLDVKTEGPVRLSNASVRFESAGGDSDPAMRFDGVLDFERVAFNPGVPITDAIGAVSVRVDRQPGLPQNLDLAFQAGSLRVAGLRTTNARARIVSGHTDGEILIPVFEADAHTGRVAGSARLVPMPAAPDAKPQSRFEATIQAAGVNFGALLADLTVREGEPAAEPAAGPASNDRGVVDASMSIQGIVGDPETRIGRGRATVSGGRVIRLPLLLQLIELSNLQIPSGEPLDEARAAFFIEGDSIVFEDLGIASQAVDIVGRGSLRWSDLGLDLRFNSRSRRRVVVVSDVLEGLRNEIATTRVTGTLKEPEFGVEQLTGARRLLESIFGPSSDDRRPIRPSMPGESPTPRNP